jgi:cell pole-organizing protein PopZ
MSVAEPKPNPVTPGHPAAEPSMEDIIASIGRIIAEDNRSTEAIRPVRGESGEILELTEAIEADGSVRHLAPVAAVTSVAEVGKEPSRAAARSERIEPDPPHTDPVYASKSDHSRERILSSATSGAAATAFARLGAAPRERRTEGDLTIGAADRTLEEIIRDTLRPLLQAWLDDHLPGLVERLVREEIARVVSEAGLR